jgi:hypothetical protein
MPSRNRVAAFIALVGEGKYDTAIERFYAEDASMQENLDPPRKGRAALVEGERRVMAHFKEIRANSVEPAFVEGDFTVIRWHFEFIAQDGSRRTLDELAYQRGTAKRWPKSGSTTILPR